jgi:hypothetical protein
MTREEHLEWCKERAIKYLDNNDLDNAWASIVSDLGKHVETANHSAIRLGGMLLLGGYLRTGQEMRKFINGFN